MLLIEFPLEKTLLVVSKLTNYVTPTNALQIDFSSFDKGRSAPGRRFPSSGLDLVTKAQA
jgi:hypothetical protein